MFSTMFSLSSNQVPNVFPKFPMCSKAFSLPRTKNPNSPSSKLAQTAAATPQHLKAQKKKLSPVPHPTNVACLFGCFFCCFFDVEFLGLSFGFLFFLERFLNLELQFFPLVFELPFRHKNKQEEKKWRHPFSPPFFFVYEIAR